MVFFFKSIINGKHIIGIIVKLAEMTAFIALSVILAVVYNDVTPSVVDAKYGLFTSKLT